MRFDFPTHRSGDTWRGISSITILDHEVPIDLTGCKIYIQFRSIYNFASPVVLTLTTEDNTIKIENAVNGIISIPEQIINVPVGRYRYDLQIDFPDGASMTYMEGEFEIKPGITSPTFDSSINTRYNALRINSLISLISANSALWAYDGSDIKSLTANWQDVATLVQKSSSSWAVDSLIRELSGYWQSNYTYVSQNSSIFSIVQNSSSSWAVDNFVRSLSSSWQNSYTVTSESSADWNLAYSKLYLLDSVYSNVNETSSDWNSVYTTVLESSSNWNSTYSLVSSVYTSVSEMSSNWDSVYTSVEDTSANWDSVYTSVEDTSANWDSVYSSVLDTSANWDSVYTSVKDTSANWDSVYTSVKDTSANWDSVYTSVKDTSANWDSVYSSVLDTSANWDSVYTSVENTSANWDSVYTSVLESSANWDSVYTSVKDTSANWDSVYTSVLDTSANWDSVYSSVLESSANWDSVYTSVLDTSANWDSVYSSVLQTSSNWDSVYTSVKDTSANWDSVYTSVLDTSANWDSVYTSVKDTSANWDSVYTSVLETSANWDSVYTSVLDASANWDSVYTSVKDTSANWDSVYTSVKDTSANWDSVYTSVLDASANWDSVYTSVLDTSANWDSVYTSVKDTSANWDSVYTSVKDTSANWDSVYTTYNQNSSTYATIQFVDNKFLPLSGGIIDGNLTITGDFSILGELTQINTEIVTTSSIEIINEGSSIALQVTQIGSSDVASFKDDSNVALIIKNGGNVGINTENPNVHLTVNGSISSNEIIYDGTGNSTEWNQAYSNVSSNSSVLDSVFSTVSQNSSVNWSRDAEYAELKSLSSTWISTHTTVLQNSASWLSDFSITQEFFDDFITLGAASTLPNAFLKPANKGGAIFVNAEDSKQGVLILSTNPLLSANQRSGVTSNSTINFGCGTEYRLIFSARRGTNTFDGINVLGRIDMGFHNQVSTDMDEPSYGCFFVSENGGNWKAVTKNQINSPLLTETSTTIPCDETWRTFEVKVAQDSSIVEYYIDNILVATHTTSIPVGNNTQSAIGYRCFRKTRAALNVELRIDWQSLIMKRNNQLWK
jgi:hypothetical protein